MLALPFELLADLGLFADDYVRQRTLYMAGWSANFLVAVNIWGGSTCVNFETPRRNKVVRYAILPLRPILKAAVITFRRRILTT